MIQNLVDNLGKRGHPAVEDGRSPINPLTETTHYGAFLLRLRWTERNHVPTCQLMLTEIPSEMCWYFATLEELTAFLASSAPGDWGAKRTPESEG